MRGKKVEEMINLVLEMQASYLGISLAEIEEKLGVVRRTAQRYIRILETVFPQMEQLTGIDGETRWRLPRQQRVPIADVSAEELVALESAKELMEANNRHLEARRIERVFHKLRHFMKREDIRRLEPDIDHLLSTDAIAIQPGPRRPISEKILNPLYEAIKSFRLVELTYKKDVARDAEQILLEPYGILYGHRNYLVARNPKREDGKLRHYAFPKIESIRISEKVFIRAEDFSLKEYAKSFFGVFQEDEKKVIWRFTPEAAEIAKEFVFHPDQRITESEDGSVIVQFEAGGLQEMAWHLMVWGENVEVLEPIELRDMVHSSRPKWDVLP